MYLDTHEREEIEKTVMLFHMRWFFPTLEKISNAHAWRQVIILTLYLGVLAAIIWILPPGRPWLVVGIPLIIFIALVRLSFHWYRKELREKIPDNSFEKWCQEIKEIEVNQDERQLFLDLIRGCWGTEAELRDLVEEVSQSPTLSQLIFVCELRTALK